MSLTASPEAGTLRGAVAPWHDRTHGFSAPIRRPSYPMPKRLVLSALTIFAAQTAGRNMTKAAYVAVTVGVTVMVLLTVAPAYEARASLGRCRAVGMLGLLPVRMGGAAAPRRQPCSAGSGLCAGVLPRAGGRRSPSSRCRWRSGAGVEPRRSAWLLAILWVLKVVPGIPGLRQLRRVLVVESGPLLSVLVIFLMVLFLASVAVYFFERDVQPGDLRQRARRAVVGGRDPDHHRLWRRGADHAATAASSRHW